jgi:hypothetical protein
MNESAFSNLGGPSTNQVPIDLQPQSLPPKKKSSVWLQFLAFLLLVSALFIAYWFGKNSRENSTLVIKPEEQEVSKEQVVDQTYDRMELLFTKLLSDPSGNDNYLPEAWLLNLTSNQENKLDLPQLASAFKYPQSPLVFFTQLNNENTISVKNLLTNEIKQYQVISHPNPEVREGVTINSLKDISPDGQMLIYNVFFSEPCPPIDFESLPPGFEGGFGPCEPEPDPNLPSGYYLYDLSSQKNTYLGGVALVSLWDLEDGKLYFNDIDRNQGLKVLDLETKEVRLFDQAQTFGYGAFPMLKSNLLVKVEGETGDMSGQQSTSVLSLTDLSDGSKKILDSGRWADIQPFASVAPDESKFIYLRTRLDNQGRAFGSLHLYDLSSGKLEQVTPDSFVNSYNIHGYWLDNDNFITTVNELGDNYDGYNNYLVKIDLKEGLIKKMSEQKIHRFIQN